ncbi:MAG: metallophosphoesterase family protein [Desulfovibrionales bacterium]
MRIAAIGDLHYTIESRGLAGKLLSDVEAHADVLVMAGDLTNIGLVEEMEVMLEDLKAISLPKIAVVGNHDHEHDNAGTLVAMMEQQDICVLDCTSCEINGVGFVGTKGFCGGFGVRRVDVFGERSLKSFVQTSIDEAARFDQALQELRTDRKVAILHYSPVRDTLEGESPELFPFLGTSRHSDVLDQHGVAMAFHGHAHHGSPRGMTPGGIPVFNVARFVLSRHTTKAYAVHEI